MGPGTGSGPTRCCLGRALHDHRLITALDPPGVALVGLFMITASSRRALASMWAFSYIKQWVAFIIVTLYRDTPRATLSQPLQPPILTALSRLTRHRSIADRHEAKTFCALTRGSASMVAGAADAADTGSVEGSLTRECMEEVDITFVERYVPGQHMSRQIILTLAQDLLRQPLAWAVQQEGTEQQEPS